MGSEMCIRDRYLLNAAERGEPNARLLLSIEETVIFNGNYQTFDELEFDPNPAAQQHLFERKALQDKYLDQFIADGYIFGHYFKAIEVGNPVIVLMG